MITGEEIEGWEYFDIEDPAPDTAQMVREFATTMGQEPDETLYADLVYEEFHEWLDTWKYSLGDSVDNLKELSDLVYVIYGYAMARGWDLDEAIRRVHENNIGRCIQPDGTIKRRDDGKIIKNKDYPKVNLSDLV